MLLYPLLDFVNLVEHMIEQVGSVFGAPVTEIQVVGQLCEGLQHHRLARGTALPEDRQTGVAVRTEPRGLQLSLRESGL